MESKVSFFNNSLEADKVTSDVPVDLLLEDIRVGKWQDIALYIRANKSKWSPERYAAEKKKAPSFTGCGTFNHRSIAGLKQHSGILIMDIDGKDNPSVLADPEGVKSSMQKDPYLFACFITIGGNGLACLFKINGKKHEESFLALQAYLFETYGLIVDKSCKDVSRLRFVSYDPYLYLNHGALRFTKYLSAPPPALKKLPKAVWVESDFHQACQEIIRRRIDLTASYHDWLNIGFAISDKMGESGCDVFDALSQFHPKYSSDRCLRQYSAIMRHRGSGITIATFYYYCKKAGVNTISDRTRLIATTAIQARKGGRNPDSAAKILQDMEGIAPEESQPIINQVFENNIEIETDDSFVAEVEQWLRQNYKLRKNTITRFIEDNGLPMQDEDFNWIYVEGRKVFDKLTFDLLKRMIVSRSTVRYNPFHDFFNKHKDDYPDTKSTKNIEALVDCIESSTGDPSWRHYFICKWLLGIVESMHGKHSVLMLILSGEIQNTGKTQFFRRLLPPDLKAYFAQTKFDKGKDDEIVMTQRILVLHDDMDEVSKKSAANMKGLLSTDVFTLREPYASCSVDLPRIAVLGGTTNEEGVVNDPTGNRRFLPINVISINHAKYNSIDKTDLFMELYWLFKNGISAELTREDIGRLNGATQNFEVISPERELLMKYYRPPVEWEVNQNSFENLTNTEIKAHIESSSQQKLSAKRLGHELKTMGIERAIVKMNGVPKYVYRIVKINFAFVGSD